MVPCYGDCAGMYEYYEKKGREEARNSFKALSKEEKDDIRARQKEILSLLQYMKKRYKGLSHLINPAIDHVKDITR